MDRDVTVTGNARLVHGAAQLTVVNLVPAATVQPAVVLFIKDISVHRCQQQSQYNKTLVCKTASK